MWAMNATAQGCWTPCYYFRHSQALGQGDAIINAHESWLIFLHVPSVSVTEL
jgi:hypothetical protein